MCAVVMEFSNILVIQNIYDDDDEYRPDILTLTFSWQLSDTTVTTITLGLLPLRNANLIGDLPAF